MSVQAALQESPSTCRPLLGRSKPDGWAFGLLVAFSVVMYVAPTEWIPGAGALRPALVTSALSTVLLLLRCLCFREPLFIDGKRGISLLLFTALAFASIRWSVSPATTYEAALELLKLSAIFLTLINLVTTVRRLQILCLALVFASVVTSLGAIRWYLDGQNLVEGFRASWVGPYADPNRLATALAMIVPIALVHVARRGPLPLRLSCAAAVVCCLAAMVVSHSRGSILGLAVALAVWLLREKRIAQGLMLSLLFGGLLMLAPQTFWERTGTVTRFSADASAMERVNAWTVTSNINSARPLVGVGFNSFQLAWPLYSEPGMRRAYAAHNIFLQVIAELGWLGAGLFLTFVGSAVGGVFAAGSSPREGWLYRGIAASTVGYLVCSLSAGFVLSPHLFILLGICAAAARVAGKEREREAIARAGAGQVAQSFAA